MVDKQDFADMLRLMEEQADRAAPSWDSKKAGSMDCNKHRVSPDLDFPLSNPRVSHTASL